MKLSKTHSGHQKSCTVLKITPNNFNVWIYYGVIIGEFNQFVVIMDLKKNPKQFNQITVSTIWYSQNTIKTNLTLPSLEVLWIFPSLTCNYQKMKKDKTHFWPDFSVAILSAVYKVSLLFQKKKKFKQKFCLHLQGHHVNLQGATTRDVCGPRSSRHDQGKIESPQLPHLYLSFQVFRVVFLDLDALVESYYKWI